MILTCAICGCAYLPTQPWDSDWCSSCMLLNFAALETKNQPFPPWPAAPRERDLHAYLTEPVTDRQRRAIDRLTRRWAEEEGLS